MAIVVSDSASHDTIGALHAALINLRRLPREHSLTKGAIGFAKDGLKTAGRAIARPLVPTRHPLWYRSESFFETPIVKTKRVREELVAAGATFYGLIKAESRYLPKVLHDNEHIEAVIYGQHESSSAMLIATSERIIYLDKKPMLVKIDELTYDVVSGIEFDINTVFATVTLHTPVKNYNFKYVNLHCGQKFAHHIEAQRLLNAKAGQAAAARLRARRLPAEKAYKIDDMAGYYWLPLDEEERRRVQGFSSTDSSTVEPR